MFDGGSRWLGHNWGTVGHRHRVYLTTGEPAYRLGNGVKPLAGDTLTRQASTHEDANLFRRHVQDRGELSGGQKPRKVEQTEIQSHARSYFFRLGFTRSTSSPGSHPKASASRSRTANFTPSVLPFSMSLMVA